MLTNTIGIATLGAAADSREAQQGSNGVHTTEDGRTMAEILADTAAAAGAVSRDNITMSEYREYVLDRISSLPIDSSQALASHAIHITDEGFAAMQKDPEYEEWVVDQLRQNFAFKDPWTNVCGGSYHVHTFGATKEAYHGESWFPGYAGGQGSALFQRESAGSQWLHETPKRRTSTVDPDLPARLRMERMIRKKALEQREFQSALLEQSSKHRQAVEEANRSGKNNVTASSPVPQFHGVSAAFLLAMLGGGGSMM